MKKAEEIILNKEYEGEVSGGVPLYNLFDIIDAINEARKECLEEAAKKVTEGTYVSNHDKQAILSLIKELK